jgi:hypothetical protein
MHHVQGLIARKECFHAEEALAPRQRTAELTQGFGLLLVNDDAGNPADPIPANVEGVARQLSIRVPVALVETSYFGGQGMQRSAVWLGGRLARMRPPQSGLTDPAQYPINSALRELGVSANRDMDEFDTLRLGRFRSNADWLASIGRNGTGVGS